MADPVYSTPHDAESAFYDAFQRGDLEAMMKVWAADDGIVCVHPGGPVLRGREAVARGWRTVFSEGSMMRFDVSDARCTQEDRLSVHFVLENIDHGVRLQQHAVVVATNVYRLTGSGWRMVLHHASPGAAREEPAAPRRPRKLH